MKRSDARFFEVISLILVLFSGCIKEDRGECPCRLVVGLDEVDQSRLPEVLVSVMTQDGFEYNEVRDSTSYMDDRIILVPRGEAFLNVYHGDEGVYAVNIFVVFVNFSPCVEEVVWAKE